MYDYYQSSSMFEIPGWVYFYFFIMIAWAILNIVLFFKIWGMTNNVAKILEILGKPKGDVRNEIPQYYKLEIGDKVFIKNKNKESVVVAIKEDKYECASNNGNFYDGLHERNNLIKK